MAGAAALLCMTSCGPAVGARAPLPPGSSSPPAMITTGSPPLTGPAAATPEPAPPPTPRLPPATSQTPAVVTPALSDLVRSGAPAYVAVSVATGWHSPSAVRPIDAPAIANPVRLRQWLNAMTVAQRADLIGRADTQVLLGEPVDVLLVRGAWAQVVIPGQRTTLNTRGYPAWLPVSQLTALAPQSTATMATVVVPTTWLRTNLGAPTLEVSFGTRLPVIAVAGTSVELALPGGRRLVADASRLLLTKADGSPMAASGSALLETARSFLGLPYLWAGTSAFGFDCSGLVYSVFRAHGVLLPRDADNQAGAGRPVPRAALQPGDLVFFATNGYIHHVAIYAGNGQILDSPRTGAAVEVIPLSTYSDYASARRVLP